MLSLLDKLQLIRTDLTYETAGKLVAKLTKDHFFERMRVYICEIDYKKPVEMPDGISINVDTLKNTYDTLSCDRSGILNIHDYLEGRTKGINTLSIGDLVYFLCYIEQYLL